MTQNMTIVEDVNTLMEDRKFSAVRKLLEELYPVDVAAVFSELDPRFTGPVFRLLSKETAAEAFSYMDADVQHQVIQALSDTELKQVLDEMYLDDTVDMLEELPAVSNGFSRSAAPMPGDRSTGCSAIRRAAPAAS